MTTVKLWPVQGDAGVPGAGIFLAAAQLTADSGKVVGAAARCLPLEVTK
jgi:hypothetical protein